MAKKRTYEVTSPIKRNGKHYDIGDDIELTEEQADGLNVKAKRSSGSKKETKKSGGSEGGDEFDPSKGSSGNHAKPSIEFIENASDEELEGFLSEDEDRTTVLDAWNERFGDDKE